ncbi:YgiW/YdeI family stress tolerance OB fold protein [Vibrio aphrogenes]|uniref:YgiW/YdeI family stress tolerance OB fold protein n=1 Tax=Vibrio aphrogenes TaxID=1891186 RepID=UPI000B34BA44|nr:NirD/YgiW/YdeI family stress tolerance protein [Vibrio aphrogenes]
MKKTFTIISLTAVFSMSAMAAPQVVSPTVPATKASHTQGGFEGPQQGVTILTSVAEAQNANDDDKVVLTGQIKSSLGHEDYVFADKSGEITVEIDDDIWQGRTITTEHTVVLHGEVDKDWNDLTIDVDRLEVQ